MILVVEEFDGHLWHSLLERTAVTSLGEGTKETGLLGERGITASLDALRSMFSDANALGVETATAAATMAVRIASNQEEFLSRAKLQGTPVFVLSGEDEAQLGFESVAYDSTFSGNDRITIIDPGGQSTEIATAVKIDSEWVVQFRKSYPVGTLGLRGTLMPGESQDSFRVLKTSAFLDDLIGMCYLPGKAGQAIVLGATGTNLVSIRERMTAWEPEKVHGEYLDFEEVSKAVGWMMPMTDAERGAIVGMEPGREKTLHIGALIVERFLNAIGSPGCVVSVRGWRHALLEKGLNSSSSSPLE